MHDLSIFVFFLPQGPPGMLGGIGQPGSVGEKVRILHYHVILLVYGVFLLLNMPLCSQGDDGETGVPGTVGEPGITVSNTASIFPFLSLFSLPPSPLDC